MHIINTLYFPALRSVNNNNNNNNNKQNNNNNNKQQVLGYDGFNPFLIHVAG